MIMPLHEEEDEEEEDEGERDELEEQKILHAIIVVIQATRKR
jgi:hypothetical protein